MTHRNANPTLVPVRATADSLAQRRLLADMFANAVAAVSPELALPGRLPPPVAGRNYILAIGKAAAAMAKVACDHMDGALEGVILTRYGHGVPGWQPPAGFAYYEAGHPIPDTIGRDAAARVLRDAAGLGADDQLVALISGGGSALLNLPVPGLGVDDKSLVTSQLLRSGASIAEINCVRKHLSAVKGGRLALAAHPARVVTIAISDIPGDDPRLIASGPTLPDRSTLDQARAIVAQYRLDLPASVHAALADPANETPDARAPAFQQMIPAQICAKSAMALDAGGQIAHAAGYRPCYLGDDLEGASIDLATVHAALSLHYLGKGQPCALISGGETSVVVRNPAGRGGRNTEYLLALAIALGGNPAVTAMACDTDGIDGTEDHAGAVITPTTLSRAAALGLDARAMLQANRSYDFFDALGDLVLTGPTRTNVNDFRAILLSPPGMVA